MSLLEVIRTRSRVSEIRFQWDELWLRSSANVFQHHAWIEAWWESAAGSRCEPNVGVCWRGSELLAVLPFVVTRQKGVRVLEWAAQAFSDYCDGIGERDAMPNLLDAVIAEGKFDLLRLKNVRPDATVFGILQQRFPGEHSFDRCFGVRSGEMNGERWFSAMNKKKRNNHRRGWRILEQSGEVIFRELMETGAWVVSLQRMIALKREWLSANKLHSDLLQSDALCPLVRALQDIGSLRVFVLECHGTLAAGLVSAVQGKALLAFFATYDPIYERSSPGILLMNEVTKWAFDHGLERVDYLRGDEAYKFEFADHETRITHFTSGRTLIGRTANLAYQLLISRRSMAAAEPEIGAAYYTAHGTPRRAQ